MSRLSLSPTTDLRRTVRSALRQAGSRLPTRHGPRSLGTPLPSATPASAIGKLQAGGYGRIEKRNLFPETGFRELKSCSGLDNEGAKELCFRT